jgi:hypothetical protein
MGNESLPTPLVIFVLSVLIASMVFAGAIALTVMLIGGVPTTPAG